MSPVPSPSSGGGDLVWIGHHHAHVGRAAGDGRRLIEDIEGRGRSTADSIQIGSRVVLRIHLGRDAIGKLVERAECVGNVLVSRCQEAAQLAAA